MNPRLFGSLAHDLSKIVSRRSLAGGSIGAALLSALGLQDESAARKKKTTGPVGTETNTTLGITAKPRIFNAEDAARATQLCGAGTETGVPDSDAAIASITKTGGVDGSAGYAIGKKVPTAKCAAGVIDFAGADGIVLNRLGFDVTGYCGAGAPRFNVDLAEGGSHFVGCAGMTTVRTFTDSKGIEWTTKRADLAALGVENAEIAELQIVFDEEGSGVLDNIAISNATLNGEVAKAPKKPKKRKKRKHRRRK